MGRRRVGARGTGPAHLPQHRRRRRRPIPRGDGPTRGGNPRSQRCLVLRPHRAGELGGADGGALRRGRRGPLADRRDRRRSRRLRRSDRRSTTRAQPPSPTSAWYPSTAATGTSTTCSPLARPPLAPPGSVASCPTSMCSMSRCWRRWSAPATGRRRRTGTSGPTGEWSPHSADRPGHLGSGTFTTRTSQGDRWIARLLVLPRISEANSPRPRVPTTSSEAPTSSAYRTSVSGG